MSAPRYIKKYGQGPLPIGIFDTPKGTLRIIIGQGRKCCDDRTIHYETVSGRVALHMIDLAMLFAMIRHNESVNYPHGRGGDMFVDLCDDVMLLGTERAALNNGLVKRDRVVPTRERATA